MKVGGKISYSTCSLNPIEDEAVVAAVLQMYGNKVKLLDVELPGFKFQPGLKKWEFMNQKSREEVQNIDAARAAGEDVAADCESEHGYRRGIDEATRGGSKEKASI